MPPHVHQPLLARCCRRCWCRCGAVGCAAVPLLLLLLLRIQAGSCRTKYRCGLGPIRAVERLSDGTEGSVSYVCRCEKGEPI